MRRWLKLMVFISVGVVVACSRPTRPVDVHNRYPESYKVRHNQAKLDRTQNPQKQKSTTHHLVQKGETLYGIAFKHGLDYKTLARWNAIPTDFIIYPGQKLRLSAPSSSAGSAPNRSDSSVGKKVASNTSTTRPAATKPAPKPKKSTAVASKPPAAATGSSAAGWTWRWPVDGTVVSGFSADTPGRQGIKIAASLGTPVHAAAPGKVVYSGNGLQAYGELVIVKHSDAYISAYAHNRKRLVKEGDQVVAGQAIAEMGERNGEVALHFEIRKNGKPTNPASYLPAR